jgi:DNA-binding MarR family transcriptional regulator
MASASTSKAAVARRVWGTIFDFLMRSAPERASSLGRRGLTPNDSRALASLDPEKGRTMRSLADEWECDASNATWIVDRLERLRLAERRSLPHDRRVKLVVLTAKGARIKAELMEEFHTPPAELFALDRTDLEALERATEKLSSSAAQARAPRRRGRPGR